MPAQDGNIDNTIRSIIQAERDLDAQLEKLKVEHKAAFDALAVLEAQRDELEKLKSDVKDALIQNEDFDLHMVDGVKVSVCPITKLAVVDEDRVDEKYKSEQVVVDVKKAQEHKKLYGVLPAGFVDKTYHRLTWKES